MSGRMYDEVEEQEYNITDASGNEWVITAMPNGGLNIMAYGCEGDRGLSIIIKAQMGNNIELHQMDWSNIRSPN